MMKTNSERSNRLTPTKRALLALKKVRAQLDDLERKKREPIAIIGVGCRFPAGADTPERFWQLLRDGYDAVTEIPETRWQVDQYYEPTPATAGKMYTRFGAFLADVDKFDAKFFGIAPREAVMMVPQQRLLLEVSWEAIERAGISLEKLPGSKSGVFVGMDSQDYSHLTIYPLEKANLYTATGSAKSTASGRLAHFLATEGPTLTVDTACSSSLVATHLASAPPACSATKPAKASTFHATYHTASLAPLVVKKHESFGKYVRRSTVRPFLRLFMDWPRMAK